jgi:DNA polymerase
MTRLSKIKPMDALDAGMLGRKRQEGGAAPPPKVSSERRERLAGLYREALGCDRCALSADRAKVVFGAGSADGRLFVAGASPDLPDGRAGLPFQGEAGELLDKILGKMGLDRKNDIFASYLQKCRDSNDAGAVFDSGCADACRSILDKQIEIIEPKALLVFGEDAAKFLLGSDEDIEKLRGVNHAYLGVPVVVTYGLPLMVKETSYRKGAWIDMERVLGMIKK